MRGRGKVLRLGPPTLLQCSVFCRMKHLLLAAALAVPILAPAQKTAAPENIVQYAHPIVGTQKMGHTYPGATVPFGMVQLSPDTDTLSYEQGGKYNPSYLPVLRGLQLRRPHHRRLQPHPLQRHRPLRPGRLPYHAHHRPAAAQPRHR
jgi:hypothetical protein